MARHRAITVGDVVSVATPLGNTVTATVTHTNINTVAGCERFQASYTDDSFNIRTVTLPVNIPYTVLNRLY